MIILSLNNITKSFGTNEILKGITFSVNENEKIGLVGVNGAGKTTLFKIISGIEHPDGGELFVMEDKKIGYLSQNLGLDENNSVFNDTMKVYKNIKLIEKRLRELEKLLAAASNCDEKEHKRQLDEYGMLEEQYDRQNGYGCESFARGMLIGLGISQDDFDKKIKYLSGGQKTRVALSKMLLQNPDLLLLDEPTNHLDLSALNFLEEFLKNYKGTVILISHDRYFLDVVTQRTIELSNGIIEDYGGNYSYFIKDRQVRYENKMKEYGLQQKEIKRLEDMIEKYRSFNREKSIRQAESREKALEKIERIEKPKIEDRSARIQFDTTVKSGNDVLTVEDLAKSYGENLLFSGLSLLIRRGEKTALIGENGKGKSTFFKIICGEVEPDSGYLKIGKNVSIGYYDQEQKNISENKTVIDEIWDAYPNMTVTQVRNSLAAFLFTGDDVFKNISDLSGGEKCKLSLLKLILSKSNFLLLDEPTNHLDILSREALERALLDYEGTLLVISHDRYFLNKVINRIFELDGSGLTEYHGNFQYYLQKKNSGENEIIIDTAGKTKTEIKEERKKQRLIEENKLKIKNEIKQIEETIENIESELNNLEESMCLEEVYSNPERSAETAKKINNIKQELEVKYKKWDELLSISGEKEE